MDEKIKVIELDFVNAYLLKANDGFVLIDTGLPMHRERLEKALVSSGCVPGNLKLVVITHGDWDHVGNCAELQKKYKTKIAMHQKDALMSEQAVSLNRKVRTLAAKIFFLIRLIKRKLQGVKMVFDKFKPDVLLEDGQSLAGYGLDAKVLHLPGHTKGSLGVLTAAGDFFSGDILVNNKKPDIAVYVDDFGDLKSTAQKISVMNIKTVYPGHGKPFPMESLKAGLSRYI
jgi:glyoxylase-like metal-dependent hydrolase (beta-lactamase superfamily II)